MKALYTISIIIATLLAIMYFLKIGNLESIRLLILGFCMIPISLIIDMRDAELGVKE